MTGSSDRTGSRTLSAPASVDGPERLPGRALVAMMKRPRYEVLALAGTAEQVGAHVPTALPVTVTSSPRRGLEPTLGLTEELARGGYSAVPHLAARLVRDEGHLAEVIARLDEAGVSDAFVVAGDSERPVGEYSDSLQLLRAIERLRRSGPGGTLRALGVAGYPEGHPFVAAGELDRALLAKEPLSSYVVTQMCFDASSVLTWVGHARDAGVHLPVHVGIAGAVDRLKLLRVAGRIGVGTSLAFLRKHKGRGRLLRASGGYRPDGLLQQLTSGEPLRNRVVAGLHVYTLGDVATTERWRREMVDRLLDGAEHG